MITTIILCSITLAGACFLAEKSVNPDSKPVDALKNGYNRLSKTLIAEIEKTKKQKDESETEAEPEPQEKEPEQTSKTEDK